MARLLAHLERTKMPPLLRNHHEIAILVCGDDKATKATCPRLSTMQKLALKRFTAAIAINKRHKGWNQHRAGKAHN